MDRCSAGAVAAQPEEGRIRMSEQDELPPLEGAPVNADALAGNPFERKGTWRTAFRRAGTRGLAAAALAIGVLVLGWNLRPATQAGSHARAGSPDGISRITAADPRALRHQIVAELQKAGVQANGYEQLGINGIDADLPQPLTPNVRSVLEAHDIPVPADGILRVEISAR